MLRFKLMLVLALTGFVVYFNALQNQFVWDDDHFIVQNTLVHAFDVKKFFTTNTAAGAGLTSDYYRPLTSLSFGVDLMVWGLNPFWFHLSNVLLHIAAGLMLFLFLIKLGMGQLVAFWISLVFLVHPVQVESVTYISSRGNLWYSLLSLVSLYLFLASYNQGKKMKLFSLTFTVVFFALSIIGKEVGLGTWVMYVALVFWVKYREKLSLSEFHRKYKDQLIACLFIFWVAVLYVILRIQFLNFNNVLNFTGAENVYTQNILVRVYTFLKIVWIYLGLVFIPHPLYMERSTAFVTRFLHPAVIASIALAIFILACAVFEARKFKTVWILLGAVWALAHILPVSGLVPMTYLYHENWLYMPIVGFMIILYGFCRPFMRILHVPHLKILMAFLVMVPIVLSYLTFLQNKTWKNKVVFFEHNLKYTDSAKLHLNLGNAYIGAGDLGKAESHLLRAVATADWYPQTHYNLGVIYQRQGKLDMAEKEYVKSLYLDYDYLFTYPLLINLYIETNQRQKALPFFRRLLAIYPGDKYLLALQEQLEAEK